MEHISGLDMRVDRHHYKNHVGENCRANHDPDMCQLLQNVNTSIMEQVNAWFGRFRHSARYMNQARFSFFVLLVCHINNKFKTYKRETHFDNDLEEEDNFSA